MNENVPQIFWLADVAGSGKSTVANHLAREWKRQDKLAGRFFFSRAAEQTRTTTYFFSTIAQQGLSQLGPKVRSAISDGIRDMSNPVAAPLEDQCRVLFVSPLMMLSSHVVLILDALDECEPSMLTRMLRVLLPQLGNLPHLRLLLTSRPDNHIIESLETFQVKRTSLRDDIESNRMDIWTFIREKLKSISIPQPKIDQLVARSEGLFIWASTVCKILLKYRGDKDQFLEDVLVQGPEQMDSLYHVALQQALSDGSIPNNIKVYKRVLSVIVVALEPLSPNTINRLLNIRNTFEIVGDLQSVLDCRHPDDPVRFLHPTFREFLLRPLERHPYRVDEEESHLSLAHACLGIMATDLRWDMCNLDGEPIEEDENGEVHQHRFTASTTHALRYSCRFWSGHLALCDTASILTYKDTPTRLEQFFQANLLDWMYIISFTKSVKEPWVLLRKCIASQLNERLTAWASDASRFLKTYYRECQSRPLDVYYHFAFTPKSTIFQKIYSKLESFPHPVVTMGLADDWPPYTSIKTHCIHTQCLSPCGSWLVTGGGDGSYPVYGVWNVELADGETSVHPCATRGCSVVGVLLSYGHNHQLWLHTICRCNVIFRWNLFTSFHTLLDETRLDPTEKYYMWSDDGSKVLTWNVKRDHGGYSLWKRETPESYFQIPGDYDGDSSDHWSFSPGGGDKLDYHTSNRLEIWDRSGTKQIFSRIFDGNVEYTQFSPNGETIVAVQAMLIHCISSLNGETIWSMVTSHVHGPRSIKFISNGKRIIYHNMISEVIIVDAINGCLLASTSDIKPPLSDDSTSFIISGKEQEVIVVHSDWEKYTISMWNPFNGDGVSEKIFRAYEPGRYTIRRSISEKAY
ncbi:hypothetical protein CPB86DRAFT_878753 [Serendipita vermifera]|nr:hypothetical protein CPB86DRAFT_878753 [Serendipita vermifera]